MNKKTYFILAFASVILLITLLNLIYLKFSISFIEMSKAKKGIKSFNNSTDINLDKDKADQNITAGLNDLVIIKEANNETAKEDISRMTEEKFDATVAGETKLIHKLGTLNPEEKLEFLGENNKNNLEENIEMIKNDTTVNQKQSKNESSEMATEILGNITKHEQTNPMVDNNDIISVNNTDSIITSEFVPNNETITNTTKEQTPALTNNTGKIPENDTLPISNTDSVPDSQIIPTNQTTTDKTAETTQQVTPLDIDKTSSIPEKVNPSLNNTEKNNNITQNYNPEKLDNSTAVISTNMNMSNGLDNTIVKDNAMNKHSKLIREINSGNFKVIIAIIIALILLAVTLIIYEVHYQRKKENNIEVEHEYQLFLDRPYINLSSHDYSQVGIRDI